jgi:putative tryptophan/tyrosine transport system substrate-binding protein
MLQLVDRKADVIIAFGPEDSLKAATAATKTIPIVMAAIDYDPFALGYATSLARPVMSLAFSLSRSSLRPSVCNW